MAEPLEFTTVLEPRGPAAAVLLTDEQLATLADGKKTPPVRVTVNGAYTFAGRVGRMGGETLVGFNKAVRTAAGVAPGDEITVRIEVDAGERTVEVPDDLAAALGDLRPAFDQLAYSHRKEYVRAIMDAKKPETRERRIAETVRRVAGDK